jgi:membrane-associated phospholipid phosphatase
MASPILEPVETQTDTLVVGLARRTWISQIFRLNLEELIGVLFFAPITFYTLKAYIFYSSRGLVPSLFLSDIRRVLLIIFLSGAAIVLANYRPGLKSLRYMIPIAFCLAIYTNLHDTIHFINPHDIHDKLIAIDVWIFGVQPSVWSEQFIRPYLTEIFTFCYSTYFPIIPLVPLVLYIQKKYPEARQAFSTIILCFYAGYILYAIFPAISPSVVLKNMYKVSLRGTPLADSFYAISGSLPEDVRDAFPSMHACITLLALLFAWKYVRWLFWTMLPIAIGLFISTIYLRHHYFIDLPAGFILAFLSFRYGPKIDSWWRSKNPNLHATE